MGVDGVGCDFLQNLSNINLVKCGWISKSKAQNPPKYFNIQSSQDQDQISGYQQQNSGKTGRPTSANIKPSNPPLTIIEFQKNNIKNGKKHLLQGIFISYILHYNFTSFILNLFKLA